MIIKLNMLLKNKNTTKTVIFFLLSFISPNVFANVSARATMVSSVYYLVTVFALLLGIIMMILSAVKLKKRGDNPNDPKSFPSAIIVTLFAGAMAFNYSGSVGTLITSFLGEGNGGYCFVLSDELGDDNKDIYDSSSCWDSENSEILGELVEKVNSVSSGTGDTLRENAEVIVALFQLIGLIYFLKGLWGLEQVSEGTAREGYGKPIVTLISSALIIDLPHTLEMLKATINNLGFGV